MRRMGNLKICPIISAKLTSQSIEELPVIVQVSNESYNEFQSMVSQTGKVKTNLPIIGGIACNLTTDAIYRLEIGRASCRERVEITVGGVEVEKKREQGSGSRE